MNFIRQNKGFILVVVTSLVVFGVLAFLNSSTKSEIEEVSSNINRANQNLASIKEETSLYASLDLDFQVALGDLDNLAEIEKDQKVFWKNLLNQRENHFLEWKKRSPEAINAEITKLFTNLRNQCKNAQLFLPAAENAVDSTFSNESEGISETYGFGLSAYDGFWPNFDEEESKKLDIQGKIIKELVGFLCNSTDDTYPLSLLEIKREAVGPTDKKHIGADRIILDGKTNFLLRSKLDLNSIVLELKFRSHTSHARSFINQLRPPFLVRNFKVERLLDDTEFTSFQDGGGIEAFGDQGGDESSAKKLLPIVTDVKSDFTILIEYLTSSREGLSVLHQKESFWENANMETYVKFLTDSGNSALIKEAEQLHSENEDN